MEMFLSQAEAQLQLSSPSRLVRSTDTSTILPTGVTDVGSSHWDRLVIPQVRTSRISKTCGPRLIPSRNSGLGTKSQVKPNRRSGYYLANLHSMLATNTFEQLHSAVVTRLLKNMAKLPVKFIELTQDVKNRTLVDAASHGDLDQNPRDPRSLDSDDSARETKCSDASG